MFDKGSTEWATVESAEEKKCGGDGESVEKNAGMFGGSRNVEKGVGFSLRRVRSRGFEEREGEDG